MFPIVFTEEALQDFRELRRFEQQKIVTAIETQLAHQPEVETRNRKRLRPNPFAEWELRVARFRVFYTVDPATPQVNIIAVGRKLRNKLFIRGEEFEL
jgi:mRNA-degrading endonuclease RelE of RelBE toxin-antitoxin system